MTQPPFQLSQADSRPMYVQIMENVKRLIIQGDWPAGQALPSIRELAVALKVSVITVKRAYQELEHEGVITTRRGMGSFVAEFVAAASQQKEAELVEHLREAIQLAHLLNISATELTHRLNQLIEQQNHKR